MDTSWQAITGSLLQTVRRADNPMTIRKNPEWQLTTGEYVSSQSAADDPRNVLGLTRKQCYRRLASAEKRRELLSPRQLWQAPILGRPKGDE